MDKFLVYKYLSAKPEIMTMEEAISSKYQFITINPLNDKDEYALNDKGYIARSYMSDNIKMNSYLFECDDKDKLEDSYLLGIELVDNGIANYCVHSGNKSFHTVIRTNYICKDKNEYKHIWNYLHDTFFKSKGISCDTACNDPVRVGRCPGGIRRENAYPYHPIREQKIARINIENIYDISKYVKENHSKWKDKEIEFNSSVSEIKVINDSFQPKSVDMRPSNLERLSIALVFYKIFGPNKQKFKELVLPYIEDIDNRRKNAASWFDSVCSNPNKYVCLPENIKICEKYFDVNLEINTVEDEIVDINNYLSESKRLLSYDWKGKTFLIAPTGTGKTSFFEKLAFTGKFDRVIIVEPNQAPVKNKCIKLLKNHIKDFGILIEKNSLGENLKDHIRIEAKLIYSVYDSFLLNYDKYMTDNTLVVIDESQNIFDLVGFRNHIFQLLPLIKSLDNVVLMTGTPTIEKLYFINNKMKVFNVRCKNYKNRKLHLINTLVTDNDIINDIVKTIFENDYEKYIIYCDSNQMLFKINNELTKLGKNMMFVNSDIVRGSISVDYYDDLLDGDIDKYDGFITTCVLREGFDFISKSNKNYKVASFCIDNTNTQCFLPSIVQISERIRKPCSIDAYYYNRTQFKHDDRLKPNPKNVDDNFICKYICEIFRYNFNTKGNSEFLQ